MRKIVLFLIFLGSTLGLFAETVQEYEKLSPGEKVAAKATIFYSEPFLFDYDKDGTREEVVMGAKLFIKKTKKGYRGYLIRGLYDIALKKPVAFYADTLIVQPPKDIKIRDIQFKRNTVQFKSGPYLYIFKDRGEGILQDEVVVKFKKKTKRLRLYGGDIQILEKE